MPYNPSCSYSKSASSVTGKYAADGVRCEIAGQVGKQCRSFVISCVAQPGAAKPIPVDDAGDGFMVVFHGVVSFLHGRLPTRLSVGEIIAMYSMGIIRKSPPCRKCLFGYFYIIFTVFTFDDAGEVALFA